MNVLWLMISGNWDLRSNNNIQCPLCINLPAAGRDVKQEVGYRVDIIVNNKVIIEVKSIESLAPVHFAQTLTYLKLSGLKLALLINFNSKVLKGNVHRIVNKL